MKWGFIPGLPLCEFLTSKLFGFHQSLRRGQSDEGRFARDSRRYQTRCLMDFELNALPIGKRLFYVAECQFLTLDDELMDTRSTSNPVKTLSAWKVDREGQM